MDTTTEFNGIANEYTQSTPSYAAEFIECLFDKYGFSAAYVVADICSGTERENAHKFYESQGYEVTKLQKNIKKIF